MAATALVPGMSGGASAGEQYRPRDAAINTQAGVAAGAAPTLPACDVSRRAGVKLEHRLRPLPRQEPSEFSKDGRGGDADAQQQ